jgi:hypothetical protein
MTGGDRHRVRFHPVPGLDGVRVFMARAKDISRYLIDRGTGVVELHRVDADPEPVAEAFFDCPCCGTNMVLRMWPDGSVTIEAHEKKPVEPEPDIPL